MKKSKTKSWNVVRVIMFLFAAVGCAYSMFHGVSIEGMTEVTMATGGAIITPEALEELQKGIAAKQEEMKKLIEAKADNALIKQLQEDLDKYKGFEEIIKKQGEEIEIMKKKGADKSAAGFMPYLREKLSGKVAELKEALKEKRGGFISIMNEDNPEDIKAAGTITFGNITGREMLAAQLIPGYTDIATRKPFLRALMQNGATSAKTIHFVFKINRDGSAAPTAEGGTKPLIDFDWKEEKMDMEKIPAATKVSTEMLADIPFMQSVINDELMLELDLTLDEQLYDGGGASPNLNGLLDNAVAFDADTLAGTIDEANNFDVIRTAVAQIVRGNFIPNVICIHPNDAAAMDMAKGSDGHYVFPPFSTQNGQKVSGVRVVENTGVDAGDYLIGDFSKAKFWQREGVNIQVGWENDDFRKNLVTIIAELRGNMRVEPNNYNAFVAGNFATDKAALETP